MSKVKTYWYIMSFVWDVRRAEYFPCCTKDIYNKQKALELFRGMTVSDDVPYIKLYQVEDDGFDSTHTIIETKENWRCCNEQSK